MANARGSRSGADRGRPAGDAGGHARLAAVALADGLGALFRLACGVLRSLESESSPPAPGQTWPMGAALAATAPDPPAPWAGPGDDLVTLLELTRRPLRELADALIAASTLLEAHLDVGDPETGPPA